MDYTKESEIHSAATYLMNRYEDDVELAVEHAMDLARCGAEEDDRGDLAAFWVDVADYLQAYGIHMDL